MTESTIQMPESDGGLPMPASNADPKGQAWVGAAGWLLSFRTMLAVGLAVVAVMTINHRFNDPDLWLHLKLGEIVWKSHAVPSTDLFSFTAFGHSWTAHEWLAQLSIYAAYRAGGYQGLMLWFATLTSVLLALAYALCYRRCGNAMVSFLGGLSVWFFATVSLAIRPLLPGHVFLVIELIVLEAAVRNPRYLWSLPPLFAIWVNCHGSYFFGLGVLGVYWITSFISGRWGLITAEPSDAKTRKRLSITLTLCALGLCANPVGFRLLLYPLDTMFHQKTGLSAVQEWMPPDLGGGRTLAMIGLVVGILFISLLRRSELRLRDLLLLAAGFWLALQHSRMIFLFGIVASPILCHMLAPLLGEDRKREHPIANAVLVLVGLLAVTVSFPVNANLDEQVRKANPTGAVDYVRRAGLSGPMLNEYVFGNYLIWALPEHKVFIDGRGDVYDWTGVFAEYGQWATLTEDPKRLLNKYGIRFCLITTGSPLSHVLPYLGWSKPYEDEVATIFVRNEP